jgi:hypothetical protein
MCGFTKSLKQLKLEAEILIRQQIILLDFLRTMIEAFKPNFSFNIELISLLQSH